MANQDELALIADRIRQLAPATETHNGKMLASVHRMTCEADQRGAFADVQMAPLRDYFDDRLERRPFGSASWNMFAALHWLADNAAAIGVAYPTDLPSIAMKHWGLAFPKADCVRPHVHAFADLIEAAGQGGKAHGRRLKKNIATRPTVANELQAKPFYDPDLKILVAISERDANDQDSRKASSKIGEKMSPTKTALQLKDGLKRLLDGGHVKSLSHGNQGGYWLTAKGRKKLPSAKAKRKRS